MTVYERYELNGDVWEVRGYAYTRYNGQPCIYVELRGDVATWFGPMFKIIADQSLTNGWVGYWFVETDPEGQAYIAATVEAQEGLQ